MVLIYDINQQQELSETFLEVVKPYKHFKGVSFVGSFKVLEEILGQFETVSLILGMEDTQTGQNLDHIFGFNQKCHDIKQLSQDFLDRISDESFKIHFTKDRLFHSKYFILEDDDGNYAILNGSMNLTKQAMEKNHEMVWIYRGNTRELLTADTIYEDFISIFRNHFENESVPYLDRRLISEIRGKTDDEIKDIIISRTFEDLEDNSIKFTPSDIAQIFEQRKYFVESEMVGTLQKIFTPKGNKRRIKKDELKEELKRITIKIPQVTEDKAEKEFVFSKPYWLYDEEDKKLVIGEHQLGPENATRDDLITFVQIIKSYQENKVTNESQQALSAFLYVMTSPLIWKIREIYHQNGRNRDQVPITLALLGQGTSGKTMTIRDYFKPFIGDKSPLIGFETLGSTTARNINAQLNFIDHYLRSEIVSPLIIDEVREIFFSGKDAVRSIKTWSNDIDGIHGCNIITSNTENVSVKPEIRKRVYYISITARYKEINDQVYDFNDLKTKLTARLYHEVVYHLNERLNNLSSRDRDALLVDFMSLTKDILKTILKNHGLLYDLPKEIWENYDYGVATFKRDWEILLQGDRYQNVSFKVGNDKEFSISSKLFEGNGKFEAKKQKDMQEYYNKLPSGVGIDLFPSGMVLNIDAFDRFLGSNATRSLYNQENRVLEKEQSDLTVHLLKEQQEMNKQLLEIQKQVLSQPKKKGFLTKIFGSSE